MFPRKRQIMAILALASFAAGQRLFAEGGSNCVGGSGGDPLICVRWDNQLVPPPQQLVHVTFSFVNHVPSVQLLRGDDGESPPLLYQWRVWCAESLTDPTPREIGSITVDAEIDFDFDVKLLQPDGSPGASTIESIVMTPESGRWSKLTAGEITGSGLGDGLVVQEGNSTGGMVEDLVIGGDLTGTINAKEVANLTIEGNIASTGAIGTSTSEMAVTDLHVEGNVAGAIVAESLEDVDIDGNLSGAITTDAFDDLDVFGDVSGTITTTVGDGDFLDILGTLSGTVGIEEDATAADFGDVSGTGAINIGTLMSGELNLQQIDAGAEIRIGPATSPGRINIFGTFDGDLIVGEMEDSWIELYEGVLENGNIRVASLAVRFSHFTRPHTA